MFAIPEVPPTKNRQKSIRQQISVKQRWMWMLMTELDRLDLDRPIRKTGKLDVRVTLFFPFRNGQELENYRPRVSEFVGDALWRREMQRDGVRVVGGWLRHDSDDEWRLTVEPLQFGQPRATLVRLRWAAAVPSMVPNRKEESHGPVTPVSAA